ncbi:MAG: hypothetical protein IJH99_09630 [Eubacterium sp.]|nr:hypothetical protein [Eubacterium sp.]
MGLYDSIGKAKKRRLSDTARVVLTIIIAAVITIGVIAFIIAPLMHHRRYVNFMNNLSKDTSLANRNGTATVSCEGEAPREMTQDELYTLYKKLVISEVYEENPEPAEGTPGIVIDYKNGSTVSIWPRYYEDRLRPGIYMEYQKTKGSGMKFATYMVQYDSLTYLFTSKG